MNRLKCVLGIVIASFSLSLQAQNIHVTACQGNLTRLDSLLHDETSINIQDDRGRSLLHYAVGCREKEVFDYLLDQGIDFNIKDNREETPLSVAVQIDDEMFFNPLINLHHESDLSKSHGASLLEQVVLNDNLNFVKKLVEKGVVFDDHNERGNTPMGIALREGSNEISDYLLAKGANPDKVQTPELKGKYLGQDEPGSTAKMFSPNFISTENFVHNGVFHPNGKEFYFTIETRRYNRGTIMVSKMDGDNWLGPVPMNIPGTFREVGPYISRDGSKLYFASNRPIAESDTLKRDLDLWVLKRQGESWGPPKHLGREVNTSGNDWFPTFADDETMYFYVHEDGSGNIYKAESVDGKYQKAVIVDGIGNGKFYNYDAYIASNKSYIIFSSNDRPDGLGSSDLYISFKDDQGNWSKPKNMGESVNSPESEYAPLLTPDGDYLFFTRGHGDIFWVDAEIIDSLK